MLRSSRASSDRRLTREGRKSLSELITKLEKQGDLPSLPQIIVRLNSVARDPKSSASDLANIILHDQSLTSRILRISNSALYGSSSERGIVTVTQAVIVLGFQNVVRLAMGIAIFDTLDSGPRDHHLLRIWIHSIACAVAAEGLAQTTRFRGVEEAFVVGLLHDVGKLVLLQHSPDEYRRILSRVENGEDQLHVEMDELGHTHQDVGVAIGRRWNLPDSVVGVLGNHDEFGPPNDSLRNVVVLANQMAKVYYAITRGVEAPRLTDLERAASLHLGVPPEKLGDVLGGLRKNVEECLGIFGLSSTTAPTSAAPQASDPGGEALQEVFVQMEADIHRKSAQLTLLQQISHALVHETRDEMLLPMVLEGLFVSLHLERLVLVLRESPQGDASARPELGFGPDVQDSFPSLTIEPKADHPLRDVLYKGRPLNVLDRSMPIYGEKVRDWPWPAQAFAAVPISAAGGVVGMLVADRGTHPLADDDLEMIALFGNQISLVLQKTRSK